MIKENFVERLPYVRIIDYYDKTDVKETEEKSTVLSFLQKFNCLLNA